MTVDIASASLLPRIDVTRAELTHRKLHGTPDAAYLAMCAVEATRADLSLDAFASAHPLSVPLLRQLLSDRRPERALHTGQWCASGATRVAPQAVVDVCLRELGLKFRWKDEQAGTWILERVRAPEHVMLALAFLFWLDPSVSLHSFRREIMAKVHEEKVSGVDATPVVAGPPESRKRLVFEAVKAAIEILGDGWIWQANAIKTAVDALPAPEAGKPDNRRKNARTYLQRLEREGLIVVKDDRITLAVPKA